MENQNQIVEPTTAETTEPVKIEQVHRKKHELESHPAEAMLPEPGKNVAILSSKDMRRLKTSNYEEVSKRFDTVYLIRHKKTGKIAEIHAASAVHAANLLGWNPKKVELLNQRSVSAVDQASK